MVENFIDLFQSDRSRIHVDKEWEVAYWSKKLGVSKETLAEIVGEVGPVVEDVVKKIKASNLHARRNY
ncbi:DUF3606 domain-containing protein [Pseudoduganella namucuonensis]|uniref:DUF3606 domain-containing protein n=1 Tax=Pseudoduganella namucuonensis TaxID=1035707 RepID=A0A1I7K067_9BURK|nr:DUF3606 domain-containing protein [Pseudoduganella namucuonensis]SFU90761.1 Protein of unknown function [Pseudoduganella namucuonensis]